MPDLLPIARPNGKPYRPRKVIAYVVGDEDEIPSGVVVFGTHDTSRAQALADRIAEQELGRGAVAADPGTVWWRDTIQNDRRMWEDDPVRGRAGVYFAHLVEPEWAGA